MARTLIKLKLKRAIILEDARRIQVNKKPINNIWHVGKELEENYPERYEVDKICSRLYDLENKGTHGIRNSIYDLKVLITDLCVLLNIEQKNLVEEIEL